MPHRIGTRLGTSTSNRPRRAPRAAPVASAPRLTRLAACLQGTATLTLPSRAIFSQAL